MPKLRQERRMSANSVEFLNIKIHIIFKWTLQSVNTCSAQLVGIRLLATNELFVGARILVCSQPPSLFLVSTHVVRLTQRNIYVHTKLTYLFFMYDTELSLWRVSKTMRCCRLNPAPVRGRVVSFWFVILLLTMRATNTRNIIDDRTNIHIQSRLTCGYCLVLNQHTHTRHQVPLF